MAAAALEMAHTDIESGGSGGGAADVDGGSVCCLSDVERECRICQMSLLSSSPSSSSCGGAIELGCACKDDLAVAHKHCADTWFKIKGNKTCEICKSIAQNVSGPNDTDQQDSESSGVASSTSGPSRVCLNGHRFLNLLLACMVFAFVISWLFHFNIPS